MQAETTTLYDDLLAVDEDRGQSAWSNFLFNVEMAQALKDLSAEQAGVLLQAGSKWAGSGWTTARAFKQLQATVGVPLVQSSISVYRDSWLFALSLFWDVEVGLLDLPDRGAEAAYALCAKLGEGRGVVLSQEPVTREGREAEEEEEEEAAPRFDAAVLTAV